MSEMRYALEMLDEAGQPVTRVAVEPEWRSLIECVGFEAARRRRGALVTALARGSVNPVWDSDLGEPYVGALRVDVRLETTSYSKILPVSHLADHAESVARALAARGNTDTSHRYRVVAQACADAHPVPAAFDVEAVAEPLPVAETALTTALGSGARRLGPHCADDVTVVIAGDVASQAIERALASPNIETGALLAGHLRRDRDSGDIFVHITAGLPALHTAATADRLTFTADTWAAARDALARRGRGEHLLGWQHHHRPFCLDCPPERRHACPLRDNFFSADDVHLHSAVFDRAYHVALLVSLDVERPPVLSLYGWRDGVVRRRSFYLTAVRTDQRDEGEPR